MSGIRAAVIGWLLHVLARLRLHGIVLPALAWLGNRLRARGFAKPSERSTGAETGMSPQNLERIDRHPLKCLVRPASGSAPNRASPLLCFLHGYDEAAPTDIVTAITRHGPLREGNPKSCIDGFVVVAPQLPAAGDHWSRYAQTVEQIIDDVSRQHGCDANRMYLTGFSFGGNGVFDLALAQPEKWAALWPVDPTRVPSHPISVPVWLSVGQVSRYQAQAFIQQLTLQPVRSDAHHDRVWVDEKVNHVQTATLAYRNARIYEWLLSKRRAS